MIKYFEIEHNLQITKELWFMINLLTVNAGFLRMRKTARKQGHLYEITSAICQSNGPSLT